MSDPNVRTRFAPSPTGYLHVGNARTALFSWLWARHNGGKFLLRIEDTDCARFVEDAEAQTLESLQWLGVDWDGEIVRQSERLDIYLEYAKQLVSQNKAYIANDSPEQIEEARREWNSHKPVGRPVLRYPSRTNSVPLEDYDSSKGHVIRYRWPDKPPKMNVIYFQAGSRESLWGSMISDVVVAPTAFEDYVLIKSDGYPTYNFAHVIDDNSAEITHVIRGDEFTSSANKYQQLYEDFGWKKPAYIHVPLILGPDKSKLSKRHGAQNVLDYRRDGYLPEALANFIALIGWSPGGDRELFFDLEELAGAFSLEGLQKSPGVFDTEKLRWMNKEHMRGRESAELFSLATESGFWKRRDTSNELRVFELAAQRAATLAELDTDENAYYFERPTLTAVQLAGDENPETIAVWLERVQRYLRDVSDWSTERIKGALTDLRSELDVTPKQLYPMLRVAVTGAPKTPALWEVFEVLGKEETLARLEVAAALVS